MASFFDEEGWWGGQQKCFASIALAGIVTVIPQYTNQSYSIQAPFAYEEYWQNPVPPVPLTLIWPQQWTFDEQTPVLYAPPNEDYWQNPAAPVPATFGPLYLPDPEENPAGNLTATVDEYFWQNPTAPVPASLSYPQQQVFDEQFPALFPQPDEDFWNNPTAPVPLTFLWPQPWIFDEQTPTLFGRPDEDFWQNPVLPVPLAFLYPQQSIFDEQTPVLSTPPTFQPDEDFWEPLVPPVTLSFSVLYLPDSEEIPAAQLTATVDEYFWANPVAPVPLAFAPLYLPDPEQYPILFGQYDEDFWQNPVPPLFGWPIPAPFSSDEVVVPQPVAFEPDEDFWINPVAPIQATMLYPQQASFDEQFPVLFGQFDEDFWTSGVAPQLWPVWTTPFTYDEVLVPPFQMDEDYWINPVAPVSSYPVPTVFIYDDIIVSTKRGQIIWLQGGPV